ncbi:protein kinase [Anatilimnocola sp. NA78]|uniref:protein kinase domain-containing protein n=1 Tax=Anatilimnocola sp. NA78 TaxID=3415683 RepID=UPI003CE5C630
MPVDSLPVNAVLRSPNASTQVLGEETQRYHIQRQLWTNVLCTAYAAIDLRSQAVVEVRHLAVTQMTVSQSEAIGRRLKIVELFDHPVSRRLLHLELDHAPPRIVLEAESTNSLAKLDFDQPGATLLALSTIRSTVEALLAAHRLGLTHGDLRLETIGIEGSLARLDFLRLRVAQPELASEFDARQQDLCQLGIVLQQLFAHAAFAHDCQSFNARETSKLRQMVTRLAEPCSAENPTPDYPTLDQLFDCVHQLERLAREADHSTTSCLRHQQPATVQNCDSQVSHTAHLVPAEIDGVLVEGGTMAIPIAAPASIVDLPPRLPRPGEQLGRYRLERKLGQGGMGAVFKAIDLSSNQPVAIKLLNQAAAMHPNAVRRFTKEARLLAALNNPHITNLLEVNDEDGVPYIVLEFVDGINLQQLLRERGPLPEREALALIADVAKALVDAHQREIVHLDIKPENILLDRDHRARLTDFGIARFIDQSQSLAMTQAGGLIGTPLYMSPEQFKGRDEVRPQSDIYSLGITLYELLTCRTPFTADDPISLGSMHAFEDPPAIRKLNPLLSEQVAAIVHKCLAKHPGDRYADAAHLVRELERLLRGEISDVSLRPILPPHDASKLVANQMTWELASSPEALWPYVANTERLNRAIGLPPVEYTTQHDAERGTRRFGTIRVAGMKMTWEEHPFEWIEGRRMSVLRQFASGPFQWFVNTVELRRLPSGGTKLIHSVKIAPQNFLGRIVAQIETGKKCQRSLDKVYPRIDKFLQDRAADIPTGDAFESTPQLAAHLRTRLAERTARLLIHGIEPHIAEALGTFLTEAATQEVARIRPIALANQLGLDEQALIDACLLGTTEGLLKLEWDILCPTCRVAADSKETLKQLSAHANCEACHQDFDTGVAGAVEMVFRIHPELRDTEVGKYCIGGPWHAPHVVAQLRLEPQERVELELELPVGEYLLRGPRLPHSTSLRVQTSGAPSQHEVLLEQAAPRINRVSVLRAGKQILIIENRFATQQIVRLERTIPRGDVLTAAQAAALPRFRELFPGEVLSAGQLISAAQVTLLSTSIPAIDEHYAHLGDIRAYAVVQSQLRRIEQAIVAGRGEVVKVVGEGVLAAFPEMSSAVEVAFAILNSAEDGLNLAIGVHRGPAIVTTVNGRLDYFGATARQALALPQVAGEGITLSESVFADPVVAQFVQEQPLPWQLRTIDLPGKPQQLVQQWKRPECSS